MFVLSVLVVLVLGGCACVWWAARGGPRWARAVATVTLAAGELLRTSDRGSRGNQQSDSDD
ncbi:hypothetical protein SAMN04487983_102458 [Streptomyces sp. yr375]|nr:hypothetical protein SAMN04487983_102458 [Streptomyces sp. yr375]